jgi:hypothetical protein
MAKKKLIFILGAGVLVLVVLVKLIWFSSVLVGKKSHDFGLIEVTLPRTVVDHTFTLTNNSGRDLTLVDVVPDCGCTTTEAYQELIANGETLILPVQLKLKQSQVRRSVIRLVFEDGTVEVLTLRAVGRLKDPLRVSPLPIVVKKDGETSLALLGIEQFDEHTPSIPTFALPAGVELQSQKWKLKSKYKAHEQIPANWSMQLALTTERELVEGDEIIITVNDYVLHAPLVNNAKPPEELPFTKMPVH